MPESKGKKALVLAGGVPQIELLKQLRGRGIETILADDNPNAVAVPYADHFCRTKIFDLEAVEELALKEQADYLITVCADQVLLMVAQVSELLGLPCYIDYKTAQNVSDKAKMKRIFRENGIPSSDYVQLDKLDFDPIRKLRYPLVVKPVDAYSSKGVRRASNPEEVKLFFEEAKKISRSGEVIIEEFCPGEEISVDAFVTKGKVKILCISNSEKVKNENRFVIFRGRYPARMTEKLRKEIEEVSQKIADSFGLYNSPLLIQMIARDDHVSVLEFCARTGGNMKWLLIKHSCGVDVIEATTDLFLGKQPDIEPRERNYAIVVNDYIYCTPGVFEKAAGYEELIKDGTLAEFYICRPPQTQMQKAVSSSDRIAGFTITADNISEFNRKQAKVLEQLKILDCRGKDIMDRTLLPQLTE